MIEDDRELHEIMRIRLEALGCQVESAHAGNEGFLLAQRIQPSCIILDVFLPDMDGLTILKRLKAPLDVETGRPSATKEIPVIIVTGKAPMIENMTRVEGASDFFLKPIDIEKLTERVTQLLEQGQHERDRRR